MSFLSGLFTGDKSTPLTRGDHPTSADIFNTANFGSSSYPSSSSSSSSSSSPSASSSSSSLPLPSVTPATSMSAATPSAPTAADTFSSAYDPAALHPMAELGRLDFLQLEEDKLTEIQGAASVLPSRGWTDDLCVGTGTTYVSGLAVGGLWGLREGMTRSLGANPSFRLRFNSILNGCTRRGTLLGNSLGVLAIFYNLTNSGLDYARGQHDIFNSLGAAAASGALYKCTAGLRPAAMSAGLMAGAAGLWTGVKRVV